MAAPQLAWQNFRRHWLTLPIMELAMEMKYGATAIFWIAISLFLAACGGGADSGGTITPSTVNPVTVGPVTVAPVTAAPVGVTVDFPNLFTSSTGGKFLPTYISHLIGSAAYPLADITLTNTGGPISAQVTVDLPVYGEPTKQTVSLAAGETKTVSISPVIKVTQLFQATTNLPANIGVTVASGTSSSFNQNYPIDITGRNTVFWSSDGIDLSILIAAMVTPHDKNGSVNALLRGAADRFPGGSMPGYQASSWPTASYTIAPGEWKVENFNVLSGESPSVIIDSVVNSLGASTVQVFIMDEANYAIWSIGQAASLCNGSNAAGAGTSLECSTPAQGHYSIVYYNPSTNFLNRTVTRHRPMTKWETTYYQAKAIFEELRSKGLTYVNLTGTGFFSSSQNVLYPSEAIRNLSANCIDGSLLFASAFEALGMEPSIELSFAHGHAIVAVNVWSGVNTVIPIETTMVGSSTLTFSDANSSGISTFNTWVTDRSLKAVDIKALRAVGLTPAPM